MYEKWCESACQFSLLCNLTRQGDGRTALSGFCHQTEPSAGFITVQPRATMIIKDDVNYFYLWYSIMPEQTMCGHL